MWSLLKLFKQKNSKKNKQNSLAFREIESIFNFLATLTYYPNTLENYLYQFKQIRRRYKNSDCRVFANLYLNWEDFVFSNQSSDSELSFKTKEDIREYIRQNHKLDYLAKSFTLIFLSRRQQAIYIYEYFVEILIKYIINNLGFETLRSTVVKLHKDEVFKHMGISSDGIVFEGLNNIIIEDNLAYPLDKVTTSFRGLISILYSTVELALGKKVAQGLVNQIYSDIKNTYSSEFASVIVKITPEDALDFNKWLSLLSKTELEKQVSEKSAELESLNDSLEYKVAKRTKELQQAYEELKELDRKKSEFISVAAHQLRTPLSGIKWSLSMFLKGEIGQLNVEQKELLRKTLETNDKVINLVNSLLETDLITKGKEIYNFKKIDVQEILADIFDEIQSKALVKDIKVNRKVCDSATGKIEADPEKIKIALENIIDNAFKYTEDGGEINIELRKVNTQLQITIEDTGIGIPEKEFAEIFNRFYRANNALRKHSDGTGLGLYISKGIIEDHGGRIWFDSKEGKGTTFYITLPQEQMD